jgi:hypothetical protein
MDLIRQRVQKETAAIATSTGAILLRTSDIFRQGDEYFMAKEGQLFYRDFNHLNINGSLYLAQRLADSGQLHMFQTKQDERAQQLP